MPLKNIEMVGQVEARRLAGLRRDVADEDSERGRGQDRVADLGQKQVRQDAREQAARTDDDHLGLGNSGDRVLGRSHAVRADPDVPDALRSGDQRLPVDSGAVREVRVERQGRRRCRQHLAAHRQDAVHLANAFLEVAVLDGRHGCDEQVAHGMTGEAAWIAASQQGLRRVLTFGARKSVLEQAPHERFRVGQGHDAVADVADRRDTELFTQHTRRASVVRDGDHRRQVAGVLLQPAKERRQACAATDRHDPRTAREEPLLVDHLDQGLIAVARPEWTHQDANDSNGAENEQPGAEPGQDGAANEIG